MKGGPKSKVKPSRKEEKVLSKDEIRVLLDETIQRMRLQNIKDKKLKLAEYDGKKFKCFLFEP